MATTLAVITYKDLSVTIVDLIHEPDRSNLELIDYIKSVYKLDFEEDAVSLTPDHDVETVYYDTHLREDKSLKATLNANMIRRANDTAKLHIHIYKHKYHLKSNDEIYKEIYTACDYSPEREYFKSEFYHAPKHIIEDAMIRFKEKVFSLLTK